MNLEQIAASLSEHFPARAEDDLELRSRRLERFGTFAFGGFGIVVGLAVLGIVYTIVTSFILSGNNPLAGVIMALFVIFAALTLAYVVFKEDLKEKRRALMKNPAAVASSPEPDTNKLLNQGDPQPIPSIVEDTTDLLPVEKKTRRL